MFFLPDIQNQLKSTSQIKKFLTNSAYLHSEPSQTQYTHILKWHESDSTRYMSVDRVRLHTVLCLYSPPILCLDFIGWPVSPGWVSNIFLRRFKKCLPEVKKVVGLSMIRIISYQSHVWFHETIANKREDLLSRRKVVEWWKLAAAAGRTKI